jgi:symplekin
VNKRHYYHPLKEPSSRVVLCAIKHNTTTMSSQTIQQMESARSLALGDGRYYPTIIPGVLPIIGYSEDQSIEIQRWGADFLAEAFASPTWPPEVKQSSALSVLATLKAYLENVEDKSVIKSAVQAAASVYPLVYRHT